MAMVMDTNWLIEGLAAIGVGILWFLGRRAIRINDTEIEKLRQKVHTANNEVHHIWLELERFKTEVAKDYIRRNG